MKSAEKQSNELDRLLELSELNLDYTSLEENLNDLTKLAARIAGTEISLINLIDNYTQWSVSVNGIDMKQMPREESVCQYTILEQDDMEIHDLRKDERFKDKDYVKGDPKLSYYYGIPLTTSNGLNIGTLCVMDKEEKDISPEDKMMLKMIARQVVRRLEALKKIQELENKIDDLHQNQREVSHDIRNPISGIIGIAELIKEDAKNDKVEEILELADMIREGGNSLMEMADDILEKDEQEQAEENKNRINRDEFCEKLRELYQPQAVSKGLSLNISASDNADNIQFSHSRLMQIVGNLISNAIKFTDENGDVDVSLEVERRPRERNRLYVEVQDSGIGMNEEKIEEIINGAAESDEGTSGEEGYGIGLSLVKHLVNKADGEISVKSEEGEGTIFNVELPV